MRILLKRRRLVMKRIGLVVILSVLTIMLVACGDKNSADTNNGEKETVNITHELGETEVQKNPEKVVVFDFGILDTLDKLGVNVVGVPKGNIPSYLEKYESDEYENVGSLKEPDFEKIAQIDPDLIIISGRQSDLYEQLQELGDTIFLGVDTSRYMESFKENTEIIGEIFEKETEVADAIAEIEETINQVKEKAEAANEKALIILANDDKISAYGASYRFGIIHDVFGVPAVDEKIEVSTHGMNVNFEYVAKNDPDILYVIDRSAAIGEESNAKKIVENKYTEKTKAYQNDRIYYLHPDFWYLSGGGLISVSEMAKEIEDSLK